MSNSVFNYAFFWLPLLAQAPLAVNNINERAWSSPAFSFVPFPRCCWPAAEFYVWRQDLAPIKRMYFVFSQDKLFSWLAQGSE